VPSTRSTAARLQRAPVAASLCASPSKSYR
jgi:hypothetical protein